MVRPNAFSRFVQPFIDGKKPKAGSPLPVQDANGNVIVGVEARPWTLDGKEELWELSDSGDIVDLDGNVVMARGDDVDGKPVYLDQDGKVIDDSVVSVARGGPLDGVPMEGSEAPELPPVEPISIEYDESAGIQGRDLFPGLLPSQLKLRDELLNSANNIGGDLLGDRLEPVSNSQVHEFREAFIRADPKVQESLLEGADEVTRQRVRASLAGVPVQDTPGIGVESGVSAENALARVQIARQKGRTDEYLDAIKEFQSYPEAEQTAAMGLNRPTFTPPEGQTRLVAEDWQTRPDAIDDKRAADAEAALEAEQSGVTQGARKERETRLANLQEQGRFPETKQPNRVASLLEKKELDPRSKQQRDNDAVVNNVKTLAAMRNELRELQANPPLDLTPEQAQELYDRKYQQFVATLDRARAKQTGRENPTRSQLETAQGYVTTVVGFRPREDIIRSQAAIDPLDQLILQEDAAELGVDIGLSDLPSRTLTDIARDDFIHGVDTPQPQRTKIRGGRISEGRRTDALRQLMERRNKAGPRYEVPAQELFQDPTTLNDSGQLLTPEQSTRLFSNIGDLADRLIDLTGNQYGEPGSAGRALAREEILRIAEQVYGPRPESMRPLSSGWSDAPATAAPSSQGGIITRDDVPVLDPEVRQRINDEMMEERAAAFPNIDPEATWSESAGWTFKDKGADTPDYGGEQLPAVEDEALPAVEGEALPAVEGEAPEPAPEPAPKTKGRGKGKGTGKTKEIPAVEDQLDSSATSVDEAPQASMDESLPPVEGNPELDELETELAIAQEDLFDATAAGDAEAIAESKARVSDLQQRIYEAIDDGSPDAPTPKVDELPEVDGPAPEAEPVDSPTPKQKKSAKKTKPKNKSEASDDPTKKDDGTPTKKDEDDTSSGKIEEEETPHGKIEEGDTPPGKKSKLRKYAGRAAKIGGLISVGAYMNSGGSRDTPVRDVRDIVPNGGSPSGPGAREMSPEQRAAIEAQLQRLQSSRQRRPYQTAHTPIGRGSF